MRRKATNWPPSNETAENRQGKITHLLDIILESCPTLSKFDRGFVEKMKSQLNRRRGIEPATTLSEKQARTLRQIIFRNYSDYKKFVPPLPSGVKFEGEVRRLLKSQPNPNDARNELIEKGKKLMEEEIERMKEDEKLVRWMDGGGLNEYSQPIYKGMSKGLIRFEVKIKPSSRRAHTAKFTVDVVSGEVKRG